MKSIQLTACVIAIVIITAVNISTDKMSREIAALAEYNEVSLSGVMGPTIAAIHTPTIVGLVTESEPTLEVSEAPEEVEREEAVPVLTYIGTLQIYGYDPYCPHCVGKAEPDGITASGNIVTIGSTVAMADYPFGTEVYIEGLGYYTVEDRGVGAGIIDVACEDHEACYAVTGRYEVYLVDTAEN